MPPAKGHDPARSVPVLGVAAYSGTGKTTLLIGVLPELGKLGVRVALVKHAHHSFDIDVPGKDSYELRRAGASQVVLGSRTRWAKIAEKDLGREPEPSELIAELDLDDVDLVIVEGFKHARHAKIELVRKGFERPFLFENDPYVVAVATNSDIKVPDDLAVLDLDDCAALARFIRQWMEKPVLRRQAGQP